MSTHIAPEKSETRNSIPNVLALRGITKYFGSFTALSNVNFSIAPGEIVGLLGENGAGKSTLMNVIGGHFPPSDGEILWDDQPVHFHSPRDATRYGIGVVHQHFMLVPPFTVAENIALHSPQSSWLFSASQWQNQSEAWANQLGWKVDGAARVENLGVGEQQRIEILKALFAAGESSNASTQPARLLLLDEPTANLTPNETRELFEVLKRLKSSGSAIVFVSHKLHEVTELCDRVVVLRGGQMVGERDIAQIDTSELASLMVGRNLEQAVTRKTRVVAGASRLVIENLRCGALRNLSLQIRAGEIVGLAGVDGNGQRELAEVLGGLREAQSGDFRVLDDGLSPDVPRIASILPDRQTSGLIVDFDLAENMALQPQLRKQCSKPLRFDWNLARNRTREMMTKFDVRTPATKERTRTGNLSGGNQQKLLIARALEPRPLVLVASDPTRGLDVGATQFVHRQLCRAADAGTAVLLISTDLDEILALSDRIGVLFGGNLLPDKNLLPGGAPREQIGALMGGLNSETLSS